MGLCKNCQQMGGVFENFDSFQPIERSFPAVGPASIPLNENSCLLERKFTVRTAHRMLLVFNL